MGGEHVIKSWQSGEGGEESLSCRVYVRMTVYMLEYGMIENRRLIT